MAENFNPDQIKIKKEHAERYIAFGQTPVPLGKKPQNELVQLGVIARSSQDPSIMEVFEGELPSLAVMQNYLVEQEKKNAQLNAPANTPTTNVVNPAQPGGPASNVPGTEGKVGPNK